MRKQKTHWPPLQDLKPLEYCYLTWGDYIARSKDNRKWEIYDLDVAKKDWSCGEADSVSYYLRGPSTSAQFEEWQRRIAGIKRKELNRWIEKHGKHSPTSTHTCTSTRS
jgi:hypothetical protein